MAANIDIEEVLEVAQNDENVGFCLACGHSQDGCEPDAQGYKCEDCGERKVMGAELILVTSI
jgi:tRNA(Ile2) C34 agmatinyltransferase TiaS